MDESVPPGRQAWHVDVDQARHPREPSRFAVAIVGMSAAAAAGLVLLGWLQGLVSLGTLLVVAGLVVVMTWLTLQLRRVTLRADAVRVDEATMPELAAIVEDVRERLGCASRVDVFVARKLEARTVFVHYFGVRMLVLEGDTLGDLDDEDDRNRLRFLLATYFGAVVASHTRWSPVLDVFGILGLTTVARPFYLPWVRATVLTGDRLAFLCCQDLRISLDVVARALVGAGAAGHLRPEGLVGQAVGHRRSPLIRFVQLFRDTPYVATRYVQLLAYVQERWPQGLAAEGLGEPILARPDVIASSAGGTGRRPSTVLVPLSAAAGAVLLVLGVAGATQVDGPGAGSVPPEPTPTSSEDVPVPERPVDELLALVPATLRPSCSEIETFPSIGQVAAVSCQDPSDPSLTVAYIGYTDTAAVSRHIEEIVASSGALSDDSVPCDIGLTMTSSWSAPDASGGTVVCVPGQSSDPVIYWSHDDAGVLSLVEGTGWDIGSLFRWWEVHSVLEPQ